MKLIQKMINHICDELKGAACYGEKYLEYKTSNPVWSKMYREMSEQELNHAGYLLQIGDERVNALTWIPEDDKEDWQSCHNKATERMAVVRLMLSK